VSATQKHNVQAQPKAPIRVEKYNK